MNKEISELLKKYKKDIVEDIVELININTVWEDQETSEKHPFGKGVSKVFDILETKAKSDGFETSNLNNFALDISTKPKSKDYIGILVHADTVPANPESWSFNPFEGTYDGEFIYGRGTQDDKGPLVGIYYALKIINDLKIPLKREVRIIVGGNEETQHLGVTEYFKNNDYPIAAFTADNEFPLVNVELGGSISNVNLPLKNPSIIDFKGGEVVNAVPEFAQATLISDIDVESLATEYSKENGIEVHVERNEKWTVRFKGKPSHGSIPQHGISAVNHLAFFITNCLNIKDESLEFIVDHFHNKFFGEGFEMNIPNNLAREIGQTSSSLGLVEYNNRVLTLHQDIRFSSNFTEKDVIKKISAEYEKIEAKVTFEKTSTPLHIEKDNPLVKILYGAYQDVTKDYQTPLIISGGGTYAKNAPNTLAFGAMFQGEEQRMHNIDERLNINSLLKAIEIYIKAIVDLANYEW